MIISASRRTDIPAFYSDWFMNQIEDHCFLTKNPYNGTIYKHDVSPELVDCIVFWTRNASKMLKKGHFHKLKKMGYNFYFQYTITGFDKSLEKNTLNTFKAIDNINALAEEFGGDKIIWRFDPIFITETLTVKELLRIHNKIASLLHPDINKNVISFLDYYQKVGYNLNKEGIKSKDILKDKNLLNELLIGLSNTALQYGLDISTCAENIDLGLFNISSSKCIDPDLIKDLFDIDIKEKKDKGQRKECGCCKSIDVGAYDTCVHGCSYCYATQNNTIATMNFKKHDCLNKFIIPDPKFIINNRIL